MKKRPRNVKIIFPSTITTFAMIFGFVAILLASSGHFSKACYLVMLALVMDGLDGKVARYTNTASEFGIQYDSLSDLVAFGVAPCFIYFRFYIHGQVTDQIYYLLPIMFLTCGAVRLARFNVTASIYGKKYFTGLPIPAAAFMIVSGPLLYAWAQTYEPLQTWGLGAYTSKENFFQISVVVIVLLSLSMISTWRFDTPAGFWFHRYRYKWVNYLVFVAFLAIIPFSFACYAAAISVYYLSCMVGRALLTRLKRSEHYPPAPESAEEGEGVELDDLTNFEGPRIVDKAE